MNAVGFLVGLGFGLVVGIVVVLAAAAVLTWWPRRALPPAAVVASDGTNPPEVSITLTERFLNTMAADLARALRLPLGTVEDLILDVQPGARAQVWVTTRLPLLGRVIGAIHCRFEVGPPPRALLTSMSAGRLRLPGPVIRAIEARVNAALAQALRRYPLTLVEACSTDHDATLALRVDAHLVSALVWGVPVCGENTPPSPAGHSGAPQAKATVPASRLIPAGEP